MPIGVLNPGDYSRTTPTRPPATLNAVNQRRWFSDALNTEVRDQDLNSILAQIRHVIDFYAITDVEGDDTLLRKGIQAGAAALTGNMAALQAVVGGADKVPYWTSPTTMSSFLTSAYSRTLMSKTSLAQWQDSLGITAAASPNVIAFGGLASTADTIGYFTGPGTMALTGFTPVARTLLDDLTTTAMRTTLGLGSMALELTTNYMPKTGGAFSGFVTLHADPTSPMHASTKQYVDSFSSLATNAMPKSGGTFTGAVYGITPAPGDDSTKLATTAWVQTYTDTGFARLDTNNAFVNVASPGDTYLSIGDDCASHWAGRGLLHILVVEGRRHPWDRLLRRLRPLQRHLQHCLATTPRLDLRATGMRLGIANAFMGVNTLNATTLYEAGISLAAKYPALASANTFTAAQTISVTTAGTTALSVGSSEPGATAGPYLDIRRDSATPAANDLMGAIRFTGKDNLGATISYLQINAQLIDPASTSKDSRFILQGYSANTLVNFMTIGPDAVDFAASPTAPTPAPSDVSNKLATTAYVDAAVTTGGGAYMPYDDTTYYFSQLVGAADRLPYFTGFDAFALATFTAKGRELTAAANDAAVRTAAGLGTAAIYNIGTTGATVPLCNTANTWTAGQSFTNTVAGSNVVTFVTTDDSATIGPLVELYRSSASPIANDGLGYLLFTGNNAVAAKTTYAQIVSYILDPTALSMDGRVIVQTMQGGSLGVALDIRAGLIMGAAAGGDMGVGTLNATTLYEAGVALNAKYSQLAVANNFTAAQTISLTTAAAVPLTLVSTDAGNNFGPYLYLRRDSASPLAADGIGAIAFWGKDTLGNNVVYAQIETFINDPTTAAFDGKLVIRAPINGNSSPIMTFGPGVIIASPTGGDMGQSTLNVNTLYEQGVSLAAKYAALTGANFTGAITTTSSLTVSGGSLVVDRIGDAAGANFLIMSDPGQVATIQFLSGAAELRWYMGKLNNAETGANAGSDFFCNAYDDDNVYIGAVYNILRATRVFNFYVSPTAPTPAVGDNTTKLATTAYVQTELTDFLAQANTFTAAQTINVGTGITALTLTSTEPGSTGAPELILRRSSATPAISDLLGRIQFQGNDAAPTLLNVNYADIFVNILDPTTTSVDGRMYIRLAVGGSLTSILSLGPGVQVGAVSDQGVGTLNAVTLYENSVALNAKYAQLGANAFTGAQVINISASSQTPLVVRQTFDDAIAGPYLTIDRVSASPAANDPLGQVRFHGRNSVDAAISYASIEAAIIDPVDATEDGRLYFKLHVAGGYPAVLTLGPGAVVGAPNNGDRGVNTLNVTTLYEDGTALSTKYATLAGASFTGSINATAITLNGGNVIVDRAGDATAALLDLRADNSQAAYIYLRTGTELRWAFGKSGVAEGGANAGSNFLVTAYDDAGASLGNAFDITRSTRIVSFAVTPTMSVAPAAAASNTQIPTTAWVQTELNAYAPLASPSFTGTLNAVAITATGNVLTNGGYLMIDRSGDATTAALYMQTDAGQNGTIVFRTGTLSRWQFYKDGVTEGGANAGSNLNLVTYDDAGASLGSVFGIARATRIMAFTVSPTAPTPALNDSTTKVATTAYVRGEFSDFVGTTHTFLATQNISMSTASAVLMTLISTDAGAAAGPHLDLRRDSASPLASDLLGVLRFTGKNSLAALQT